MNPCDNGASPIATRDTFDAAAYLALHPDVAAAVQSGVVGTAWQHYELHGRREGRAWLAKPDRLAGVDRTIAPDDEMFTGDTNHYFDVGESARECVDAALLLARRPPASVQRGLDLPCGHGRVLRFLRASLPAAQFTACDLNLAGVDFCARQFGAEPLNSAPDPARIETAGRFDVIWCGSLLTHLPAEACDGFMRFFLRALAPGGVLVVTLHGRHSAEALATGRRTVDLDAPRRADLLEQYRRTGFGYVDYAGQHGYGFSLTHPAWVMRTLLSEGPWRLLGYHECGWDGRQDVLSLQRLSDAD